MKSIRFAKKKALLITSQSLVNVIKKNIINNTNIDIFTKSYKLVNSKNINDLKRFNYKCTLRSYGKLYILYLIKINNQNYCLFINLRKKDIISVRVKFKDSLYNGTLIYGELLKDNDKNWIFVTSDIYLYQGKLLNNFNLDKRIEILKNIFITEYNKDDNLDPCIFKVKKYFEYKYLLSLKDDYSKALNYRISGFMFNRTDLINDNYVYIYPENRNNNNNQENEIFFKISDTKLPDVYELYCYDNNNLVKYGYASIPNIKTSKLIQKIFEDNAEDGDIIVSCKYSDQFNKWIPIRKCLTSSISSLKTINKILKK